MNSIQNLSLLRKARRAHRHQRRMFPSLPPAIPGAGIVLPNGGIALPPTTNGCVALPLEDGSIAVYVVVATESCVRAAAQSKANLVKFPIAAE